MTNGIPDIWDLFLQNQPSGWSPPPGIEGSPGIGWSMTFPKPTKPDEPGSPEPTPPIPQPTPQGGNMPVYGQNPKRNQSYFPNAGTGNQQFPQAPGVAEGQARMDQIAKTSTYKSRRAGLNTFTLPSGGTVTQVGNSLPPGYARAEGQPTGNLTTPYSRAAVNAAPVFTGQPQAYAQGFGNPVYPQRQPQGGLGFLAGNLARSAMNQFSLDKGAQRLGQIGTLAANAFSWLGGQNAFANRGMSGTTSQQNQNFYAYNPSPAPPKPFKYFYD